MWKAIPVTARAESASLENRFLVGQTLGSCCCVVLKDLLTEYYIVLYYCTVLYMETASLIHMAAAVVPASVANSRNMFCLATPASELSAWRKEETEFCCDW